MEYKERSLTRDGATLFATADATKKALVVDKVVVSDHVVTAGTDLSTLTLADFTNAKQFDANNASQNTTSFTVTSVLTNEGLTEELNVALIGLLAHVEGSEDDARIIAVAVGNDPFSLPVDQGTVFKLVPSIKVGFSYAETVTVTVADDVYVTQANLQAVLKAQGFATEKELEAYLKALPANVALTDKANVFTEQQVLSAGAVNGAGAPALFKGDVDVPSDVVRADMLKPNLIDVATDDWIDIRNSYYGTEMPIQVVKGENYAFVAEINGGETSQAHLVLYHTQGNPSDNTITLSNLVPANTTQQVQKMWTADITGTVYVMVSLWKDNTHAKYRHLAVTHSNNFITYEQAQANRHGWNGIDENSGYGAENLVVNSGYVTAWQNWKIVFTHADVKYGVDTNSTYHNGTDKVFTMATTYADEVYCSSDPFPVVPNSTYAYSVLLAQSANVKSIDLYYAGSNTTQQLRPCITVPFGGFVLVRGTFITGSADKTGQFRIDNNGSTDGKLATLQFIEPQVAHEEIPSPWKPSPKDVNALIATAKQQAIDQIQPLIDAEMKKRNVPSYFWSGDATAYAAVTPKVATADYSVFD